MNKLQQQLIPELQENYNQKCKSGKELAKTKNLCVVSLARNVGDRLEENLKIIQELGDNFQNFTHFIYENDSTDNTVEILTKWSDASKNHHLLSEKLNVPEFGQSTTDQRMKTMSYGRNKCVDFVKTLPAFEPDFVLVIDLDFIDMDSEGIYNSLGWINDSPYINGMAGFSYHYRVQPLPEGMVTKDKILTNYDSWAYRHNCWSDLYSAGQMYWFWWWIPAYGSIPFTVNSAFGGSCIYHAKAFIEGVYTDKDCEHVTFHHDLKQKSNFNLFVNPSQTMLV